MIGQNLFVGLGNLTKDPELRYTPQNNEAVCTLRVAITRPFKNKQTQQYEADFINVVVWRKTAEYVADNFTKGDPISFAGRLQTRHYDGQDGKTVYVTEIVADNIVNPNPKRNSSSEGTSYDSGSGASPNGNNEGTGSKFNTAKYEDMTPIDDGEIPF